MDLEDKIKSCVPVVIISKNYLHVKSNKLLEFIKMLFVNIKQLFFLELNIIFWLTHNSFSLALFELMLKQIRPYSFHPPQNQNRFPLIPR